MYQPELYKEHMLTTPSDLWSVKFYPFTPPGADPIFAVVGNEYVSLGRLNVGQDADTLQLLICRPSTEGGKSIEIISSIKDEDVGLLRARLIDSSSNLRQARGK